MAGLVFPLLVGAFPCMVGLALGTAIEVPIAFATQNFLDVLGFHLGLCIIRFAESRLIKPSSTPQQRGMMHLYDFAVPNGFWIGVTLSLFLTAGIWGVYAKTVDKPFVQTYFH